MWVCAEVRWSRPWFLTSLIWTILTARLQERGIVGRGIGASLVVWGALDGR